MIQLPEKLLEFVFNGEKQMDDRLDEKYQDGKFKSRLQILNSLIVRISNILILNR